MSDQPYYLISFLCALQGVLLSLVFLRSTGKHPGSRMLGAYLFLFAVGMLENYLAERLTGSTGMFVYSFLGISNFLYGPLLYLLVHFLTEKGPAFRRSQLLHVLPFTCLFVIDSFLILVLGKSLRGDWPIAELVVFEILVVQLLTYNVLAIRKLHRHRQMILQIHSTLEQKDLRWLQLLLMLLTGIYLLSFSTTHLVLFGFEGAGQYYVLVQALLTAIVYLMSYRVLFQPGLFLLPARSPVPTAPPDIQLKAPATLAPEKYQRSGLTSSQAETYAGQLLAYMETEKPYLDPELTIHTLADKLKISRNHLTEVMNESLGQNFYEFVNAYRVEEVKRLLTDSHLAHLNLAALGLEAGFKSKTAFNANFRKFTGTTPSKWKADISQSPEIRLKEVLS